MIIRFKHFNDSLDISVIFILGCEFFSAKCEQFFYHLPNKLNEQHYFSGNIVFIFEINLIKT